MHTIDNARLGTLGEPLAQLLRYHTPRGLLPQLATAQDVFHVIGTLHDGVTRPGSPYKVDGLGPVRFNEILDWLTTCGYSVERWRLKRPGTKKGRPLL